MFLLFPYSLIFSFFLFLSTFIVISAPNWLAAWFSLELNLLRIIPLLISSKSLNELESTTKYFFAQGLGSILILLSAFSSFSWAFYTISLGLLIKLGLIPFHFWFPAAMSGVSWEICILISTWQKFPLLALSSFLLPHYSSFFLLLGGRSVLAAGLIGLNQTQLRSLLAYSSIAHTGWILALISQRRPGGWLYFWIYSMITISSIFLLRNKNALFFWSSNTSPLFLLLLLSLGGLPPFTGFAIKLGAIRMIRNISIPICILIIIGSLLSLYFYLSLRFNLLFRLFSLPLKPRNASSYTTSLLSSVRLFRFLCIGTFFLFYCALTLCNKPQRYWNSLFYSRDMVGTNRNLNKTFNSCRARPTRIFAGKWPALQCYCNCPCFSNNFLPSYTRINWWLRQLTYPADNWGTWYSFPPIKQS